MQPGPYAPQAPQPPAGASAPPVGPTKWWFAVAGAVAVVGVIVAVVVLVAGIAGYVDRVDDFDRADLPATLDVEITDTGGYSIYHEYDGAYSDDFSRFVSDPDVSVTDPAGEDVDLDRYSSSVTYEASGHEGEGLYTFDAGVPGTYEVTASGEPGSGIAVGRGIGRGMVAAIVGSLAIGFVAVVAGAVIAIVVGVTRSRNRRALRPAPRFGGWGPPPGPVGPGGYGPTGYGPGPGGYGSTGYGPGPAGPASPGAHGQPPPPPPPPAPTDAAPTPSDAPRPSYPADAPPPRDSPPPSGGAPGVSPAVGVAGSGAAGPIASILPGRAGGAPADPPSLRAPVDWARPDVPLPWSPRPGAS
jgi:hypothetical protein